MWNRFVHILKQSEACQGQHRSTVFLCSNSKALFVCVCLCMFVCLCVCERERAFESEDKETVLLCWPWQTFDCLRMWTNVLDIHKHFTSVYSAQCGKLAQNLNIVCEWIWLQVLDRIDPVQVLDRIDYIIGLFCKWALLKRLYSAEETYNLIDPTNRSHPIMCACVCACLYDGEREWNRERIFFSGSIFPLFFWLMRKVCQLESAHTRLASINVCVCDHVCVRLCVFICVCVRVCV